MVAKVDLSQMPSPEKRFFVLMLRSGLIFSLAIIFAVFSNALIS